MAIDEPIAVVGIGCRFPGGITTMAEFWETLYRGIDKVSEVPPDRFDAASLHDKDRRKYGAIRSVRGGFVPDVHSFDAEFFGLYPVEASNMDPQQRLVLEASVHALEDSGTPLEQVSGSRTGVFLGSFAYDYMCMQSSTAQSDNSSRHLSMGTSVCSISNRVSHRLDLHGPSITLDTACSSSLAALHLACQSLRTHESEAALAGGVNTILRPGPTIALSKAGFLSPDGSCKSFDAGANGYVRSEGVGIVFLKPLSRALRDEDRIYACIRGSLVNQDGYTPEGYTVPSLFAQAQLLRSVYAKCNVDPAHLQYVEAHGTGTAIGDPVEAGALGQQLGQARSPGDEPLWIGSVKGNFGHLEGAAGIAGFIKASMVTFHGEIPPQVHYNIPNPAIDFESLHLQVPTLTVPLTRSRKRLVGVNSFGAGGTNVHAILEEAPDVASSVSYPTSHQARIFVLSARSPSALTQAAEELASHLRRQPQAPRDVAYTLSMRRSRHAHTLVVPAATLEELVIQLDQQGSGQISGESLIIQRQPGTSPNTAFLFSGQGGQWLRMGMALVQEEPVFRESLDAFDGIFTPLAGFSIQAEIDVNDQSRLNSTIVAQPAIMAIQVALARVLISYGIIPGAVVGHSVGEIAAAHIAGALTLEEAITWVYYRSQIQSRAAGLGTMLAVGISSAEAKQLIRRLHAAADVEIAAYNGPKLTTLTGGTEHLKRLADDLEKQGIFARFVNVDTPYHSHYMDPLENDIVLALSSVQGKQTNIPLYSTVSKSVEPGTHLTGNYWFENIRKPVQYVETATRMLADGFNFLVEIGPHPILVSGTRAIADSAKKLAYVFPSMVRGSEVRPVSRLIGAAYGIGVDVDISSYNGGRGRFVDLPLYPFQRQPYWHEHPEDRRTRLRKKQHPFLRDSMELTDDGRCTMRLRLSTGVSPFLTDHVVDGSIVFPMTGHVEVAYLAAKEHVPQSPVWLEDLRFENPLILSQAEDYAPQALLEFTSAAKDYVISARPASSDPATPWQVCSRGRINIFDKPPPIDLEALNSVKSRMQAGTVIDIDSFYQKLEESGIRYGETFRGIQQMWRLGKEVFALVKLPSPADEEAARFHFHPALLDACFQTSFAYSHYYVDPSYIFLPYAAEQIHLLEAESATTVFARAQVVHHDNMFIRVDGSVYSEDGRSLAVVKNLTLKRLEGKYLAKSTNYSVCFCPETKDDPGKRMEVDYQNVLILRPRAGDSHWSSTAIRQAFPRAQTHDIDPKSAKASWRPAEWGFQLDRRTLFVVPAFVSILRSGDHHEALEAVIRGLVLVASWNHDQHGTAAVVILTEGACVTLVDKQCDPLSASIEAAVRVMANEMPQSRPRLVDLPLDSGHQPQAVLALLEAELRTTRLGRHETVVAIRSEGRFFRRILPIDPDDEEKQNIRMLPARGGNYLAEPVPSGTLEDVLLRQQPPPNLGVEDVGIEVYAAGLNYKMC
ncbi:Type I Polyketide synthases (Type I PKS) [Aspergillus tanneri]|uniref:Type I Polyketide synthases (Type I PKS) n=1 Tax=Aspergillus tanneri TaxID=1220188 RepID=A0A5M9MLX0_9EURO|nr:Type I Polyketide synthases (Type I PKS) [Aspergillus tanneri]KAA8645449.1 Type I Polyketide synthases (Type I PKS) [Aspergillus tanneri]